MARGDIRQKISLDGGDEVRRQLVLIGAAGEKALRDLSAATTVSSASLGRFTQLSTSLSTAFAATGHALAPVRAAFSDLGTHVSSFGNAVRSAAGPILPFNANMLAMAAALTAAVAPFALFAQAKKAALATDDLVDTAENLNITTEELVAFRQVSEASGASFDVLEKAIQKGNRTLGEAVAKTKDHRVALEGQVSVMRGSTPVFDKASKAVEVFRGSQEALTDVMEGTVRVMRGSGSLADVTNEYAVIAQLAGTTVQKLAQLNPTDRFLAEAKAISGVKNETEQARLASAAWGKSYAELLPLLRDAATELKPAIERVKEFGQGVSEAEKVMSAKFLLALARMNTAWGRLSTFMGGTLGIAMIPVFKEIERVIVANRAAVASWAKEMGTAVAPAVQDLVTIIGNLGRSMEEQQPLHTSFGQGLVSTFGAMKSVALGVAAAFKTLSAAVDVVLIPINKMFGTELTGGVVLATALVLKFVGAFALLGGIVTLMKGLGIAIGSIMAFVGWPVAVIAGLTALTAALLIHTDAWKNFKGIVNEIGGILQSVGTIAARAASGDFAALKQVLADLDRITFDGIRSRLGGLPGLVKQMVDGIGAEFAAASADTAKLIDFSALLTSLDDLPGLAKQAADGTRAAFANASADTAKLIDFSALRTSLGDLPGLAKQAVDGVKSAFSEAWTATATLIGLDGIWSRLGALPVLAQQAADGVRAAWADTALLVDFSGILTSLSSLPGAARTAWGAVGEAMTAGMEIIKATWAEFTIWLTAQTQAFWVAVTAAATAVDQNIRAVWGGLAGWVTETLGGALTGIWTAFSSAASAAFSSVNDLLRRVVDAARSAASAIASAFSSVPSPAAYAPIPPMATGGLVRGPGTGTSDSILARLSNREYINTARAVDFWGVDFFEKINRLQNPFKGFALGGLVDSFGGLMGGLSRPLVPRQRFATGGLVTAPAGGSMGTPVHFHFPGGESFGPMITDERIAQGLGRLSRRSKMLSAGRPPGHYGS